MQIDRHNYEEFFLLYVDNELSAAERRAVDNFAEQNPDLQKELLLLKDTVLDAPASSFENKTSLFKKESDLVLEEKILLYLDGELGGAAKKELLESIERGELSANEMALLQTKLVADETLVYADKASLYRKSPARVIPIAWKRIAAAAIILGMGIWAGILFTGTAKPVSPVGGTAIIKIDKPVLRNEKTPVPVNKSSQDIVSPLNSTAINADPVKQGDPVKNIAVDKTRHLTEKSQENIVKGNAPKTNDKPGNDLHKPLLGNFNKVDSNQTIASNVLTVKTDAVKIDRPENKIPSSSNNDNKVKPDEPTGYALNTSFREEKTIEKNDNKILYMDEDNVKKSKLGGFLRKVKRVVERNTNIKTGNGIRVAGLDIAIN